MALAVGEPVTFLSIPFIFFQKSCLIPLGYCSPILDRLFLQDCQASQECINFSCVPKSCKAVKVENGRIVGLSPMAVFAVDKSYINDVVIVDETSLSLSERYPVGFKVIP